MKLTSSLYGKESTNSLQIYKTAIANCLSLLAYSKREQMKMQLKFGFNALKRLTAMTNKNNKKNRVSHYNIDQGVNRFTHETLILVTE